MIWRNPEKVFANILDLQILFCNALHTCMNYVSFSSCISERIYFLVYVQFP
jgi:hypothetical protein